MKSLMVRLDAVVVVIERKGNAVIGELLSDPRNNSGTLFPQVTRAIGFPGKDAVDILAIDKNYIQTVKSTSNYFSISRFRIEKE